MKRKGYYGRSQEHGLNAKGIETKYLNKEGKIKKGTSAYNVHRTLYEVLDQKYGNLYSYPFDVPLEKIHKTGKEIGMDGYEIGLFMIGYVGTDEAIEYAKKHFAYHHAIDEFLGGMMGRGNIEGGL